MLTRRVFTPVRMSQLTAAERAAILRSTMFCRDKVAVSGAVGSFKARLVAGGDMQDKTLYDDTELSSPTAATTSLLIVAAIAASEQRHIMTMDVGASPPALFVTCAMNVAIEARVKPAVSE